MFNTTSVGTQAFNLAGWGIISAIGATTINNNPKAAFIAGIVGEFAFKGVHAIGKAYEVNSAGIAFLALIGTIYFGYKAGQKVEPEYTPFSHFSNVSLGVFVPAAIMSIFLQSK